MDRRGRPTMFLLGGIAIALATTVLTAGCNLGAAAGGDAPKAKAGAISAKEEKAAGQTIKGALKRGKIETAASGRTDKTGADRKGRPSANEKKRGTDERAPSFTPMPIPEVNYAAMDTARLAAVMQDILVTPEPYYYSNGMVRDIFEPLVRQGSGDDEGDSSDNLRIVGILWAERDRFALAQAPDGRCRILREGDSLGDGYVVRIAPDKVIVHITQYGTSRNVTLPLVQGGGFDENPQSRGR